MTPADLIFAAWQRVAPELLRDRDELKARLSRRNTPALQRPPRAWCVAIRAADARLAPYASHAPDVDLRDHPPHGGKCPHALTLTADLLRTLTAPITLAAPGEPARDVARKVGRKDVSALLYPRVRNVFDEHHVRGLAGKRGMPQPVLYTPRPLDPNGRLLAPADPVWSWTARDLADRIPRKFEQTITRVPTFRACTDTFRRIAATHPEAAEPSESKRSPRLKAPAPDHVWYKWSKDNQYLGDDPQYWRKSFKDPGDVIAARNAMHAAEQKAHERRLANRSKKRRPSKAMGSEVFAGYRWLCPGCNKLVKTIYYPLEPINLLAPLLSRKFGTDANALPDPPPCLACRRCHRLQYITLANRNDWNHFIGYITGGLLFGREVPKPEGFHRERKNHYTPQLNRTAPRREKVMRRVLNGWTIPRIARDLGVGIRAIHNQVRAICKSEQVPDRHALAKKLKSPHAQPLTQDDRAAARRSQVLTLLLAGRPYQQIMTELSIDFSTVNRDTAKLYKQHGVSGRRGLARKLGVTLQTDEDRRVERIRTEIRERRASGETKQEIAEDMRLTFAAVDHHVKAMRKYDRSLTATITRATILQDVIAYQKGHHGKSGLARRHAVPG